MHRPVLLIVDDDELLLTSYQRALKGEYEVLGARSASEALALLSPPPEVILLDLRLRADDVHNREGLTLLKTLQQQFPQLPVLMITAYGDIDIAVECMKHGAVDFIQKPQVDLKEIKTRLTRALEHARLSRRVSELEKELHLIEPRRIVGISLAIQEIKKVIEAAARDAQVTVLILGDTGTGKELVARAIHASGWRGNGPFVAVTVNTLPPPTIASELFGYEPGAFTDARGRHIGYLEKAHGGVLFLDEVGNVEPGVQDKLLRFLEEREFQRLGNTKPIKVDVQIIAATNSDLEKLVRKGLFRKDLYSRLNVLQIVIPRLNDRAEDIPVLSEHFLQIFRARGKKIRGIGQAALALLNKFDWPGNIRQLKNALESAVFWAELRHHEEIEVDDLPADVRQTGIGSTIVGFCEPGMEGFKFEEVRARGDLSYIDKALRAAEKLDPNKIITTTADLLGITRFKLTNVVKKIFQDHPHLTEEFPYVKGAFKGRQRNSKE